MTNLVSRIFFKFCKNFSYKTKVLYCYKRKRSKESIRFEFIVEFQDFLINQSEKLRINMRTYYNLDKGVHV